MPSSPLFYENIHIKLKEYLKYHKPTFIRVEDKTFKPDELPSEYLEYFLYKSELIKGGGIVYIIPKEMLNNK